MLFVCRKCLSIFGKAGVFTDSILRFGLNIIL